MIGETTIHHENSITVLILLETRAQAGARVPQIFRYTLSRIPGDLNSDGGVDLGDYAFFAGCSTGVDEEVSPGCEPADLDGDSDFVDFGKFQASFGS